ncbi:FMRFamide receptor [Eurytemora carolleeae]|uniref:FMRFamide receptor n=1 Tax=Eurytemora carolleeae TaxID=1294199 RepID=UPI000C771727|nr:FMRFamide receptor [Eurytemora carolleeae]|eukprot:XP_023344148.1 FMRFamide receptor-like [Eurytemora affinis]
MEDFTVASSLDWGPGDSDRILVPSGVDELGLLEDQMETLDSNSRIIGQFNTSTPGQTILPDPGIGFWVEGVLMAFVGVIGIIGNILGFIRFSVKSADKNFHQLMKMLAVFDFIYIFTTLYLFSIPHIYPQLTTYDAYIEIIPFGLPLAQIGLTGSIYCTVAIAVERYTIVCHPFFKFSAEWKARMYLIPIVVFSLLFNLPKFFELTTEYDYINKEGFKNLTDKFNQTEFSLENLTAEDWINFQNETLGQRLSLIPTRLRSNQTYIQVYLTYLNLFIHGVIPILALLILNIRIYFRIKSLVSTNFLQGPSKRELALTQVSLVIVAVFLVCHGVRWIPNLWELSHTQEGQEMSEIVWPAWITKTVQVSHVLTVLNSSVNFYIYIVKQYRGNSTVTEYQDVPNDTVCNIARNESFQTMNGVQDTYV